MDPGDISVETRPRKIWTSVYTDVEGLRDGNELLMLFTVARDREEAETAFERYIAGEQDDSYDISASDRTDEVSLLPGESPLHAVTRLHQLGFRFVFPLRDDIEDSEVADLVALLTHFREE